MQELLIKAAISAAKRIFDLLAAREKVSTSVVVDGVEAALSHHFNFIENWSRQVSLRDLPRSRPLSEVFVRLSLSENRAEGIGVIAEPTHLLTSALHSVLLGHPGAGKTTIVKHLCQHLLHEPPNEKEGDAFSFPILILLRDIQNEESLIEYLLDLIGITFRNETGKISLAPSMKEAVAAEWLNTSKALLFLDGFDELRPQHSLRVRADILRLANLLTSAKFILTSRIGSFECSVDNAETLYVCPFDSQQILAFSERWLGSKDEAESFLSAVSRSPYHDTIGRPLILVNLCMVFQTYGELPEPPTLIYQKVIDLLLEYWDRQRDLRRVSRYGRFGPERKRQFLGALAYALAAHFSLGPKYRDSELKEAYRLVCTAFSLPIDQRNAVVEEIESHTGLFARVGIDQFEFSHKSLQEYLCADHIARLPDLNPELARLADLPNECAIATALSASPNGFFELMSFYFMTSIGELYRAGHVSAFWGPYLTRLRIEGVSFTASNSLGFAFLFVASLIWRHLVTEANHALIIDKGLLQNLIGFQASSLNSVRQAISSCTIAPKAEGLIELRMSMSSRKYLPPQVPGTIVVGIEYIDAVLVESRLTRRASPE